MKMEHSHEPHVAFTLSILRSSIPSSNSSIHIYDLESFREVGNAYLLSGGSEGIVASSASSYSAGDSAVHDGRSHINFENITFWKMQEAAGEHTEAEHSTVIFEAADRDTIGGSAYGGQRSICCIPDLAKLDGCKRGEVPGHPTIQESPGILSQSPECCHSGGRACVYLSERLQQIQ